MNALPQQCQHIGMHDGLQRRLIVIRQRRPNARRTQLPERIVPAGRYRIDAVRSVAPFRPTGTGDHRDSRKSVRHRVAEVVLAAHVDDTEVLIGKPLLQNTFQLSRDLREVRPGSRD